VLHTASAGVAALPHAAILLVLATIIWWSLAAEMARSDSRMRAGMSFNETTRRCARKTRLDAARARILEKMKTRTNAEIARYAIENKLVEQNAVVNGPLPRKASRASRSPGPARRVALTGPRAAAAR